MSKSRHSTRTASGRPRSRPARARSRASPGTATSRSPPPRRRSPPPRRHRRPIPLRRRPNRSLTPSRRSPNRCPRRRRRRRPCPRRPHRRRWRFPRRCPRRTPRARRSRPRPSLQSGRAAGAAAGPPGPAGRGAAGANVPGDAARRAAPRGLRLRVDRAAVAYAHPPSPLPWEIAGGVAVLALGDGRRRPGGPVTLAGRRSRQVFSRAVTHERGDRIHPAERCRGSSKARTMLFMAPNRVVVLAAPLIAPLAGAFAAWLSQAFPGIYVPREAMEEVFLAVAALVFGMAFQFNHNRYKWDELIERQELYAGGRRSADRGRRRPRELCRGRVRRVRRGRPRFRGRRRIRRAVGRRRRCARAGDRRRPVVADMALSARTLKKLGVDATRRRRPAVPGGGDARMATPTTKRARGDVRLAAFDEVVCSAPSSEIAGAKYRGPQRPRQREPREACASGARVDPGDRAWRSTSERRQELASTSSRTRAAGAPPATATAPPLYFWQRESLNARAPRATSKASRAESTAPRRGARRRIRARASRCSLACARSTCGPGAHTGAAATRATPCWS